MSRILGLDLGSGSIGWAVINYSDKKEDLEIINLGCRIIPIDGQTLSKFETGQALTINADRTSKRSMRKTLDRYQDRRNKLQAFLHNHGMMPNEDLISLDKIDLWRLRADAIKIGLSKQQLGRVLLLLCRKRGYNASKSDLSADTKDKQGYVSMVKNRYDRLKDANQTIGEYFHACLSSNPDFRIKDEVLPRQAYIEEFDKIMECQSRFHPEILTEDNIKYLRDFVLFYQRPLKSCKHLVSKCEFETSTIQKDGKTITIAPKVAHRTNPLFQISRIWQVINGISFTNVRDPRDKRELSLAERSRIFNYLMTNEKMKVQDLYGLVFNDKKQRRYMAPDNIGNGIPGNKPYLQISKILGQKYKDLLQLNLNIIEKVDPSSSEAFEVIDPKVIEEPYYRLWHTIYSLSDPKTLQSVLQRNFNLDDETSEKLAALDLTKEAYGNMSEKALKRIIPYLIKGEMYSEACRKAGFKHSQSLTKEENEARTLNDSLAPLAKSSLRQPIVEKILNQLVNLVNSLVEEYGSFDEIHIELARELKMSREERSDKTSNMRKNERLNDEIAKRIQDEFGLTPTRNRIVKMKLWEESSHLCMYCGQPINATEFLNGYDVEVEHVIPKSLLFDDSFANKVCACRKCNREKGNMTAYDFMFQQGDAVCNEYVARVRKMAELKKISKTKRDHLLMSKDKIPSDFINRQLRESQYVAKYAKGMLLTICRNVVATSGSVTDYLRHIWGWDQVLHNLNLDRYAKSDMVEEREIEINGQLKGELKIKDWNKRCDHRHHAIDALTIACTTISIIQRLNNLSSLKDTMFKPFVEQGYKHKEKQSQLEKFVLSLPHFSYQDVSNAIEGLLVSLKQNLKTVTTGKRYVYHSGKRKCVQQGIMIPRGPLHEETIYGKIKRYDKKGNLKEEFVVKYPLTSIKSLKDAESIVDEHIKKLVKERLKSVQDMKKAFDEPLYSDTEHTKKIGSVRCFTGLTSLLTIQRNQEGIPIGFAKPGANHHVAIYKDDNDKLHEHIVTFKHSVDRKLKGFPMIIKDPKTLWNDILASSNEYPEEFLSQLPSDGWKFMFSMRRNELFIIGLSKEEIESAISKNEKNLLNAHLYKIQNLSSRYYNFVLLTQTQSKPNEFNKPDKRFIRISSLDSLAAINPIKVRVDLLGKLSM